MNVLRLNKVSTAPWGPALLHEISLELNAGEILGIIGPNGAGKTSLLQALSGDVTPSDGELRLMGTKLSQWKELARARIAAVLPQLSLLNFPYTVEEVIMLGRTPHSSGFREDRKILREVMTATDTTGLQDRIYTQLSGGEKQRVQLARVFAQIWQAADNAPRLLMLDEPTAALDLAHQQLILESLRQLAETGCAIAIVAHDFNLVAAIVDQVTALKDGHQIAQGTPADVFTREMFARVFGVEVIIADHPNSSRPLVISL
jgi:iron complex transport system ATP-binding protein